MPPKSAQFTVRPSNSEKEMFRVKMTVASLLSLKANAGDLVSLQLAGGNEKSGQLAIAWDSPDRGMKDNVVLLSKSLQELYGFKLGDKINIVRSSEKLQTAGTVVVECVSATLSDEDQRSWEAELSETVPVKHDVLGQAQKISIENRGRKAEFIVRDMGGSLGRVTIDTKFAFNRNTCPELVFDQIGGLQREIEHIKEVVELLLDHKFREHYSKPRARHGLLLYGAKGTGKTLLQETLAQSSWGSVVRWSPGIKLPAPVYPRLIITDLLDATGTSKAVSELLAIFRDIKGTKTLVVGETRHPNEISERLRAKDAFSVELELPIPDADQRLDILRVSHQGMRGITDVQLQELAMRTHGYVGADLDDLSDMMWKSAWKRCKKAAAETHNISVPNGAADITTDTPGQEHVKSDGDLTITQIGVCDPTSTKHELVVNAFDINESLKQIRPSALQQVFLEKPTVRWSDIGGQHALKHRLKTTVERMLSPTLRERMTQLGLQPTKGILLYGPPGCSKTLLVKALATEAELNFLAVKGAELISMYVGESERATREVFRKARAAAPSILFFDEIDSIASRSTRPEGGSSHGGGGGANDINVLTTLLNEMDGFEELKGVLVVAATNKPQQIDPALLRPGRFDKVVHVDLPDADTRREIFEHRFRHVRTQGFSEATVPAFVQATAGFSGAEIVGICQVAGEYALDADLDAIEPGYVEEAIRKATRGISQEMKDEYDRWNASRSTHQ